MKKATSRPKKKRTTSSRLVRRDDILPEYDFSRGRPNSYAERYAADENLVKLDADVAAVFPDARAVNDALRALAGIIQEHRSSEHRQARKVRNGSPAR
jgi:hypothetical protein